MQDLQINIDGPVFEKIKKRVLKEVFPKSYMRHKYYEDKVAEIIFIIYDELIANDNEIYEEYEYCCEYEFGNKSSKKEKFEYDISNKYSDDIDENICLITNNSIEFDIEL